MEARVADWIARLGETNWSYLIVDSEWRLVFVSDELKGFLGEHDDERLGVGRNVIEALVSEAWLRSLNPESVARMIPRTLGRFIAEMGATPGEIADRIPEAFRPLIETVEPQPGADIHVDSFLYRLGDRAEYRVDFAINTMRDRAGAFAGMWVIFYIGMRPNLVALLALGDEAMYERMARLIEPGRRQAAILFADLEDSGVLSRRMSTASYFRLISELTTQIDRCIAQEHGIVGKHAGDGITGFFLTEDLGGSSAAAAAAIRTARGVQKAAAEGLGGILQHGEGEPLGCAINVGLHWGTNLYMGQLVPGGRLDVTALGDEVNECARIQESAGGGKMLASKSLVEQLSEADAGGVGIDPEHLLYRPLASLEGATEKAVRDAGTVAVAAL